MARIASLVRSAPAAARSSLAESKLALAELLVASADPSECAQRALDWLGQHTGIRTALCLFRDYDEPRMTAQAGLRIPLERWEAFSVDLEDEQHPLVAALIAPEPVVLPATAETRRLIPLPLGASSCLAMPLPLADLT